MLTGELSMRQALEEAEKLGATHYQRWETRTPGVFGGNWELSSLRFYDINQECSVAGCKMEVAVWLVGTGALQPVNRPSGLLGPKNMDRSDLNAMAISGMLDIGRNFTP
ncbi:hypothetical protein ACTG16_22715 [Aeromonas sp. 23P]|uniref:hypothetical protein n=1 Tax=Aeromonas sp. 23P TaxID=3452716 RepID=UPI003F7A9698|nr:hypothetical protein [Aeromonas veronii]